MKISVVILTFNEARHIARAIESISGIAFEIIVVDSHSVDGTQEIAASLGANVLENVFETHARQFNWALQFVSSEADWVFRLDADEIATPELAQNLKFWLAQLDQSVAGVALRRRIVFMGKPIRWGGVFPISIVRVFRRGKGRSEDRLMDEHITVDGELAVNYTGEIHDISLHSLSHWLEKHNKYSTLEALEVLHGEYGVIDKFKYEKQGNILLEQARKQRIYNFFPRVLRPFLYLFYRCVIRLGVLDGARGLAFHVLQGFWYRYIVELKVMQVEDYIATRGCDPKEAISEILDVTV